ncbi:MAG: hypothetical protein HYS55_01105 [Candidatus Omnitrophica bacterium]|nr:hypothetical protein [Candidatus Omnitrophota bacterium]
MITQKPKLDAESKTYVEQIIPLIVGSWSSQAFLDSADPAMLEKMSVDDVKALFKKYSESFGKYKEYKNLNGKALIEFTPHGKVISASYIAEAIFEKADDAKIRIHIIKHDKKWQIDGFYLTSKQALLRNG